MPGASTIRQFVQDLHDRKSNIARVFDQLFGTNPGRHKPPTGDADVDKVVAWLKTPGSLPPLSPEARSLLQGLGLSPAELSHIDGWPDGQRNDVRDRLVDAIENDNPYHFFWELHSGTTEDTVIPPLGGGDIVFRSPREKVSVGSVVTFGAVNVDV